MSMGFKTFIFGASLLTTTVFAQSSLQKPWEHEWGGSGSAKTQTFTRDSKTGLEPIELKLEATQSSFRYVKDYYDVRYPEYDDSCEDQGGNGSTGNWYNAFDPYVKDKARALSDAIQGLDYEMAQYIVAVGGFLTYRPASWRRFTKEIARIDKETGSKLYATVVCKNWEANQKNLGYKVDCQPIWTTDRRSYWRRELIGGGSSSARKVGIFFEGGLLLSGESETFQISFNGRDVSLDLEGSNLVNLYRVEHRTTAGDGYDETFVLKSEQRSSIAANWLQASAALLKLNGKLVLKFKDSAYLPLIGYAVIKDEVGRGADEIQDVVHVEVFRRDYSGRGDQVFEADYPAQGETFWNLSSALDSDGTYYAEVRYRREGSRLFSRENSNIKRTADVQYRRW